MHRSSTITIAALLALATGSAAAQQMYKCGNTFSQTPCGPEATVQKVRADAVASAGPGLAGLELCGAEAARRIGTPEPETARVAPLGARKTEVIQYAGTALAAHRYDLSVSAKSEAGFYMAPQAFSCWVSEDQRRVLQFGSRR